MIHRDSQRKIASLALVAATVSFSTIGVAQDATDSSATRQPASAARKDRNKADAGAPSVVEKANASADKAADDANRAVAGDSAQKRNQSEAQKAAQRAQQADDRKRTNEAVNRSDVAADGRRGANANGSGRVYPDGSAANKNGASATESGGNARAAGSTNVQPDSTAADVGHTAASATAGVENTVSDMTRSTDVDAHYDPFAIELNPIGLFAAGRLSLSAEWVPVTHHAIVISPHIVHTTNEVAVSGGATQSQAYTGFGGEIGYRYYTGHRGMNGVFVGPSLIGGVYNAGLPQGDQAFTNLGLAADVGFQQIFWDHFVLGGGVGIEYLSVSHDFHDLPLGPSTIASSGVKPRLLLEAGYGF
ncbi:MAG: DUF3575 domain-containing protein [Myxococcota bacterium]|nr:DUF3575 domain-containing protein [Myxococcota bacterium]